LSHFVVEEELDRHIRLSRTKTSTSSPLDPRRLKAGSSEIRNWIVVASAAADLDLS